MLLYYTISTQSYRDIDKYFLLLILNSSKFRIWKLQLPPHLTTKVTTKPHNFKASMLIQH